MSCKIVIPPKIHVKILNLKNTVTCLFYNDFFYYYLAIVDPKTIVFVNEELHILDISLPNPIIRVSNYWRELNTLLYGLNFLFVAKFRFKGKGYRIFRKSESKFIKFFFGHSHMRFVKFNYVLLLKPHKYKFIVFSNSYKTIKHNINLVNTVKTKNIFTKRGLGYTRQILFKRKGKGALI
jgi:hypothetical protein